VQLSNDALSQDDRIQVTNKTETIITSKQTQTEQQTYFTDEKLLHSESTPFVEPQHYIDTVKLTENT
jgi:hypothetical protein